MLRTTTISPSSSRVANVRLSSCELVNPVQFEETLPDGRLFTADTAPDNANVRLYLEIESQTDQVLAVAFCSGGLAVVRDGSPKPYCERIGDLSWTSLPPGGSVSLYPTIALPTPIHGTFTAQLLPNIGHAPLLDWPTYRPNPVAFKLDTSICSPAPIAQ